MLSEGNLELLRDILVDYKALHKFLLQQREAIRGEKIRSLGPLLAESNQRVRAIEEKTKAFRERVKSSSSIPDSENRINEIAQTIKVLFALSQQNEKLMAEEKRKLSVEIERIRTGEKLIGAYRPGRIDSSQILVKNC